MLTVHRHIDSRRRASSGFTLVEMLVAVALVLLMMTMFAEIFTLATGSMSKQKGLAELDQRQRMVSTLLRDDFKNRSYTNIAAFHQADDSSLLNDKAANIPFDLRQGYFYISENDPENDSDDVLQLTVTRTDGLVFYGRTRELLDAGGNGAGANPNQPENDDGSFYGEGLGVGSSPSAEVAYFLRNNILYRRVLLLRNKSDITFDDAPSAGIAGTGSPLVQAGIYPVGDPSGDIYVNNATAANRFLNDFDYSANNNFASTPQMTILAEQSGLSNLVANSDALGRPHNRFGFQRATGVGSVGFPKEYLNASTGAGFIGRFTHEETSHVDFGWPGNPGYGTDGTIGNGDDTNPYTRTGLALTANGVVSDYVSGPRQGEDILLTNVQSFDVKVWDPGASAGPDGQYGVAGINDDGQNGVDDAGELGWPGSDDGAFVDIGYGPATAPNATAASGRGFYFARFNNKNSNFGPLTGGNRCFDTWNVGIASAANRAPYRPALPGVDLQPGIAGVDDDGQNGVDDAGELGWPNSDDVPILITAIQIRVRYLDIASGLVREVTIIENLTPETFF